MEGVPRLPMVRVQMKDNRDFSSVDWMDASAESMKEELQEQITEQLRQQISENYSDDPHKYDDCIKKFLELQNDAYKVVGNPDFEGCNTLKKYYGQLYYMQSRFNFSGENSLNCQFMWADAFTGTYNQHNTFVFEQTAIIFNLGACHSFLGAVDNRTSEEGTKVSCVHFQCAAGFFQYLADHLDTTLSPETSQFMLKLFTNAMLGQGQECLLEKSMQDNRKDSIIAKISQQVVDYYKAVLSSLNTQEAKAAMGDSTSKNWIKLITMKLCYYSAITKYYLGCSSWDQEKYGEGVAYLGSCLDSYQEAVKACKALKGEIKSKVEDALKYSADVFFGKHNSVKKDNEFVYHDKVPDKATLPDVKGASLVKALPFDPSNPSVAGPDIFEKLVPMEAHLAASSYSEEKAKLLRSVLEDVQEKDLTLEQFKLAIELDPDKLVQLEDEDTLDPVLVEHCALLNVDQTPLKELTDAMKELSDCFMDIDSLLDDTMELIEEEESQSCKVKDICGKTVESPDAIEDIQTELQMCQEVHAKAGTMNDNLHTAMKIHISNLKLVAEGLTAVKKHCGLKKMVSILEMEDYDDISLVKKLCSKVKEMEDQRQSLMTQLRSDMEEDDVTSALITNRGVDAEDLFKEELKKHDKTIEYLKLNLDAQENILNGVTEVNVRYSKIKKLVDAHKQSVKTKMDQLILSCTGYKEAVKRCKGGTDFFKELLGKVSEVNEKMNKIHDKNVKLRKKLLDKHEASKPPPRPAAPKPKQSSTTPAVPSIPAAVGVGLSAKELSEMAEGMDDDFNDPAFLRYLQMSGGLDGVGSMPSMSQPSIPPAARLPNTNLARASLPSVRRPPQPHVAGHQPNPVTHPTLPPSLPHSYNKMPASNLTSAPPPHVSSPLVIPPQVRHQYPQQPVRPQPVSSPMGYQPPPAPMSPTSSVPNQLSTGHFYGQQMGVGSVASVPNPRHPHSEAYIAPSMAHGHPAMHQPQISQHTTPSISNQQPTSFPGSQYAQVPFPPPNQPNSPIYSHHRHQHVPAMVTRPAATLPQSAMSPQIQQNSQPQFQQTPVQHSNLPPGGVTNQPIYGNVQQGSTPAMGQDNQLQQQTAQSVQLQGQFHQQQQPYQQQFAGHQPQLHPQQQQQQGPSSFANQQQIMPQQHVQQAAQTQPMPLQQPQVQQQPQQRISQQPYQAPQMAYQPQQLSGQAQQPHVPQQVHQQSGVTQHALQPQQQAPQQIYHHHHQQQQHQQLLQQQTQQVQSQPPQQGQHFQQPQQKTQQQLHQVQQTQQGQWLQQQPQPVHQQKPSQGQWLQQQQQSQGQQLQQQPQPPGQQPLHGQQPHQGQWLQQHQQPQQQTQQHQQPQQQTQQQPPQQQGQQPVYKQQPQQGQQPQQMQQQQPMNTQPVQRQMVPPQKANMPNAAYHQSLPPNQTNQYVQSQGQALPATAQVANEGQVFTPIPRSSSSTNQQPQPNIVVPPTQPHALPVNQSQRPQPSAQGNQSTSQTQGNVRPIYQPSVDDRQMQSAGRIAPQSDMQPTRSAPAPPKSNFATPLTPQVIGQPKPAKSTVEPARPSADLAGLTYVPSEPLRPTRARTSADELLSGSPENPISAEVPAVKQLLVPEIVAEQDESMLVRSVDDIPYKSEADLMKFKTDTEEFSRHVSSLLAKEPGALCQLDKDWKKLSELQEKHARTLSSAVGRCSSYKNRFQDILPFDQSRVVLRESKDDYINASLVGGVTPYCPRFIATQSPLPSSVSDFWMMIHEQQVTIIVMLVSKNVDAKKCAKYWPEDRNVSQKHGPVSVTFTTSRDHGFYVERTFTLKHAKSSLPRSVIQVQYTAWPEHGLPVSTPDLLSFMRVVRNFHSQQRNLQNPIVVHCEDGVSQTGTFCASLAGVQELEAGLGIPDVLGVVEAMRKKRKYMVQEKAQLKFVHDLVLTHAVELLKQRGVEIEGKSSQPNTPHHNQTTANRKAGGSNFDVFGSGALSTIKASVEKMTVREKIPATTTNPSPRQPEAPNNSPMMTSQTSAPQPDLASLIGCNVSDLVQGTIPVPDASDPAGAAVGSTLPRPDVVRSCTDFNSDGVESRKTDQQQLLLANGKAEVDARGGNANQVDVAAASSQQPGSEGTWLNAQPPQLQAPAALPGSGTSLLEKLTPQSFTLGSEAKERQRFTKADFMKANGSGLGLAEDRDHSDPFGDLDPLWSLKSGK